MRYKYIKPEQSTQLHSYRSYPRSHPVVSRVSGGGATPCPPPIRAPVAEENRRYLLNSHWNFCFLSDVMFFLQATVDLYFVFLIWWICCPKHVNHRFALCVLQRFSPVFVLGHWRLFTAAETDGKHRRVLGLSTPG